MRWPIKKVWPGPGKALVSWHCQFYIKVYRVSVNNPTGGFEHHTLICSLDHAVSKKSQHMCLEIWDCIRISCINTIWLVNSIWLDPIWQFRWIGSLHGQNHISYDVTFWLLLVCYFTCILHTQSFNWTVCFERKTIHILILKNKKKFNISKRMNKIYFI